MATQLRGWADDTHQSYDHISEAIDNALPRPPSMSDLTLISERIPMSDQHRPTERENFPQHVFHYWNICLITPELPVKMHFRNIPKANPARAVEWAIRDIMSAEEIDSLGSNFTITGTHIQTTQPDSIPFDPDHPES